MNKTNVGPIFNQIYRQRFGKDHYLYTESGWIKSFTVYLDLSDIDMLNGLGTILDFYRKLINEGNVVKINIPGNTKPNYCDCWNTTICSDTKYLCMDCNLFICNSRACHFCKDGHSGHKIKQFCMPNGKFCVCCSKLCEIPVISHKSIGPNEIVKCYDCIINYDFIKLTDPIINFNLYEWIPIGEFLENRNPDSIHYGRKMSYNLINDSITLQLIHSDAEYYLDTKSTILVDNIARVFEYYGLPKELSDASIKYVKTLRYTSIKDNIESIMIA